MDERGPDREKERRYSYGKLECSNFFRLDPKKLSFEMNPLFARAPFYVLLQTLVNFIPMYYVGEGA